MTLGNLIPFLGGDRTAGLQPARGRLVKVDGELGGLTDGVRYQFLGHRG